MLRCTIIQPTSPKDAAIRAFFESDDIAEIKDFAMRLAFIEGNDVYVQDTALGEIVRDFEDARYRNKV